MNKIYTLIIGILCLFSISLEARTVQEASAVASAFMQAQNEAKGERLKAKGERIPIELAFTQYQIDNTTPAVFVFNSTDEGFVLVSAEDNARAVLGYSDNGTFDANNIPENMQFWLQMYADEIRREAIRREAKGAVSDRSEKGDEEKKAIRREAIRREAIRREAKGERREAEGESYPTISPILGETIWGQGKPFNNKCPEINGERTVTGCVATALSQIMYVHQYPTKGTGSHSYTTESKQLEVSADFGSTTYDWANMIPNYTDTGSYTTTQADAVATLMFHVGVAADMDYTVDGSGAVSSIALAALTEYFGYDKAIHVLPKDFMKEENLLQAIATDLQVGRPVYFSGVTVKQEGHAFVCDGMKSDGYLHINWGWNGMANGYFAISALAPEVQGTGGSASNLAFTESVGVYTNIRPDTGGKAMPLVIVDKLIRTSKETINKTEKVSFDLDRFTSAGIATAEGTITYFIYNSNQELVEEVEIGTFELDPGYYYTSAISISEKLPNTLANGNYELEIRYIDDNEIDHPILIKGLGEVRVPFTVNSSQFVFGEAPKPEVELRNFTNADFSLVTGTKTWAVDLFSSQFWEDAPSEKDVLIRFNIHSNSNTSVIGTYTMESGTIEANAMYAEGYYQACYQYTPTALHLTITPAGDDKVTVQYYMEVNGKVMQGSYTTTPDWYEKDGDTYYYNTDYNYDLATTLPASKALQITSALSHTEKTEISYLVHGKIVHFLGDKEEIVLGKEANFYISDDGGNTDKLFCTFIKWLNNSDFITGNELLEGDQVVLMSPLLNYGGQHPTLANGYIYQHIAGPNHTASVENITTQDYITIYDIMGRQWKSTDNLPAGVYLINGKKAMITK